MLPPGELRDTVVYCFCTSPRVCTTVGTAQKDGALGMCKMGGCLASTVSCKACEIDIFALQF